MPFPTPEYRKGTALFPQQKIIATPWLEKIESKLDTLSDKPIELIFGLNGEVLGTTDIQEKWHGFYPNAPVQSLPNANHFTQVDRPESFVLSLIRILKQLYSEQ
ncbi:hypothetical protein CWC11_13310 [Pseudoalteromonas sp. S3178]|uniref:hypothetical protein n=1 Tax=Pseudoalteromonas sp. S3178 TaxID=579532 RepID=UPI00110BAC65|nr:hypothetical protein [Pseudoalteromonas sp. S3178]TMP03659.1 hypothetical protein CWC11_13310 [Pseudoalteromonas sp. S3178]